MTDTGIGIDSSNDEVREQALYLSSLLGKYDQVILYGMCQQLSAHHFRGGMKAGVTIGIVLCGVAVILSKLLL